MARGVSQEERLGAITVLPGEPEEYDPDLESAYDQWREDLGKSQTVATLRVYRIPTNEKGDPVPNARNQAELFSAALDLYTFDEVINRVRREFMPQGMAVTTVRLMGTKKRSENSPGGIVFNQIVTVEKAANEGNAQTKESTAELMRVIQESAQRQMEMLERVMGNRVQSDPLDNMAKLGALMTTMMTPLLTAIGGGGRSSMKELMEMLVIAKNLGGGDGGGLKTRLEEITLLKSLATELGGGEGSDDGDTPAGIIKAVSPLAGPIMETIAAFQKNQAESKALAREQLATRKRLTRVTDTTDANRPRDPGRSSAVAESPAKKSETPQGAASSVNNEDEFMLKLIREQLHTLTDVAAENGDPVPLAAMLIENIPEEYDEKVLAFLENKNCIAVLESLHPKVKEHRAWFERFHKACLDQFFPVDDDEKITQFKPQHELTPQAKARLAEGHRVQTIAENPEDHDLT